MWLTGILRHILRPFKSFLAVFSGSLYWQEVFPGAASRPIPHGRYNRAPPPLIDRPWSQRGRDPAERSPQCRRTGPRLFFIVEHDAPLHYLSPKLSPGYCFSWTRSAPNRRLPRPEQTARKRNNRGFQLRRTHHVSKREEIKPNKPSCGTGTHARRGDASARVHGLRRRGGEQFF